MVEGSANGSALFFRSDGGAEAAGPNSLEGWEVHTNHPIKSEDLSDSFLAASDGAAPTEGALGHWGRTRRKQRPRELCWSACLSC